MALLVMTATFKPNVELFVKLTDPMERMRQYMVSLVNWASVKEISSIVIVENSGLYYKEFLDFAQIVSKCFQKPIEFFCVNPPRSISNFCQKRGKGAFEGYMLDMVIAKSQLIRGYTSFFKITGRLFVANFRRLYYSTLWDNNFIFANALRRSLSSRCQIADTKFFHVTLEVYNKFLRNQYLFVDDRKHVYLEHVYFRALEEAKNAGYIIRSFSEYPYYVGVSGTSLQRYTPNKVSWWIRNLALQLGLYNL